MQSLAALELLLLAAIPFILAVSLLRNGKHQASHKIPPGYSSLPFIGETLAFIKPFPATSLGPFMRDHISRFGKVFTAKMMGEPIVISADAAVNRSILRNERKQFDRVLPPAVRKIAGEESPFIAVGDVHRFTRSMLLDFLSRERLRTVFLPAVNCVASEVISTWKEGSVISAKAEATKFSLYLMARTAASMMESEIKMLQADCEAIFKGFLSLPLHLPGTTYWKALQSRKRFLGIFRKRVEKRMKRVRGEDSRMEVEDDLVSRLMRNTHYSPENICEFLLGVFAAQDTTPKAITALFYFLRACPSALQQLRAEHLQVASKEPKGGCYLTWDDYRALEFTKCVINETLRLGVSSLMLRKATEDAKFDGYVIPKDCRVLLHFTAVHKDPSVYKDPECFNPWRWLSSSGTENLRSNFMPFGSGKWQCPGAELAKLEMAVFLHHLVLKYDWEFEEADDPVSTYFVDYPKGLPIKVRAIQG